FLKKNILHHDVGIGCISISQLGNSGWRSRRFSPARIARLLRGTPCWSTFGLSSTIGDMPCHVILLAPSTLVSTSTNLVPFPCIAKMPQHRSIGLYVR